MQRVIRQSWFIPAALLIVCFIAYSPLIPSLGVYWDDWPSLWFLHFFGPGIFPHAFAIDRPAQGWLFTLTTALWGEWMPGWQVFGILARWLSGLALFWLLRLIWPRRREIALWAAALFLVYPGFSQQFIPITYGHQFLVYTAFLLSLALMLLAVRRPAGGPSGGKPAGSALRRFWLPTLGALALEIWSMFALEYFFGLELLRPALLLIVLIDLAGYGAARQGKKPFLLLRRVFIHWLPYAAAAGLFLLWRLTHFTPRGTITLFERLSAGPDRAIAGLAVTIGQDLLTAAVLAWGRTFAFLNPAGVKTSVLIAYTLVALAACLVAFLLVVNRPGPHPNPLTKEEGEKPIPNPLLKGEGEKPAPKPLPNGEGDEPHDRLLPAEQGGRPTPLHRPVLGQWRKAAGEVRAGREIAQPILLSFWALFIAGWPVWVTDLRLELTFPWDRFTLPLMLGATLLLAGLIDLLPARRMAKLAVVALLIGLAAGAQFRYALDYRRDWAEQKAFFWQLAWRAPGIEPGTLLLFSASPFAYATDNSLSAPLNWIYAPALDSTDMPYLMYALDARLGSQLPELQPGNAVVQDYRATRFSGSTSQALVLFYDPPRCLKVLDPSIDGDLPNKPDFIAAALPLSRPELIHPQGPALPDRAASPDGAGASVVMTQLFGPEPPRGWCYYYEQAELAARQGDWPAVVALAIPAFAAQPDLTRDQAYELLPFIQGYAFTGDWPAALDITRRSARLFDKKMPAVLCDLWQQIGRLSPAGSAAQPAVRRAQQELDCPAP